MSVSVEDLERGLTTVARLIQVYGDDYWPVFERLEKELSYRLTRQDRINKVLDNHSV